MIGKKDRLLLKERIVSDIEVLKKRIVETAGFSDPVAPDNAIGREKASDCSSATNAVLTAGSEKASDCSSATNAVLTAGSEKAADCEDEKAEDTRIAEIK